MSLAYELATRGMAVTVVDRQTPGLEASWAGAGILPPGSWYDDRPSLEALAALSGPLNVAWSKRLREQTQIDNQLSQAGALHLAESPEQAETLHAKFEHWRALGIEAYELENEDLREYAAILDVPQGAKVFHVPGESVVDNRLHLQALADGCRRLGVSIIYPAEVTSIHLSNKSIESVATTTGTTVASRVVLAAGAWSRPLAKLIDWQLRIRPMRGQMIEFETLDDKSAGVIVHSAGRYVVPRRDGRMIVGSTVEDVGFDKRTTAVELAELECFARRLSPSLQEAAVQNAWAGLRPASADGLPYIGPAPAMHNMYVSAGHFRAGLQMASGSAVALADVMTGLPPSVDLKPFRVDR